MRKASIILLSCILICGCAISTPETNAPSITHNGPIVTGRIAKLNIVSRRMDETRWDLALTDVAIIQDSPALQVHLKDNTGHFVTMVEEPYSLFRYRGHFVGTIVGKDSKVYLNADLQVVRTEGNWQFPGEEGKYISAEPVYGCITTKDGNRLIGDIQWDASTKTYYLESQSITKKIPQQNVLSVQVKKETDIEMAIALFQEEEYQQAIPLLKKAIASDRPFGSSVTAIRWLADCYLQLGQPDKVIKLFETKKWLLEEDSKWSESSDCKRIYNQALNELQKKENNSEQPPAGDS
ncbi:MAG: tetratricopeptide repeat protein [Kiritimatiellae bacterium]|jgi:tetratricopeptide (TPR) repeat protein|nr:tetratricopeptide repeat protein [Kiritimatiellia bacterium]